MNIGFCRVPRRFDWHGLFLFRNVCVRQTASFALVSRGMKISQGGGEEEEEYTEDGKNKAAQELGKKGGKARAAKLSKKQRSEIAKKAASARWAKSSNNG